MLTVRLPEELEEKINKLASEKKLSKSQIVKEALSMYLTSEIAANTPYEKGKSLFGKYGSGKGDLSKTYKTRLKEKIREKNTH